MTNLPKWSRKCSIELAAYVVLAAALVFSVWADAWTAAVWTYLAIGSALTFVLPDWRGKTFLTRYLPVVGKNDRPHRLNVTVSAALIVACMVMFWPAYLRSHVE